MKLKNIILPIATLILSTVANAQQIDITELTIKKVLDNLIISFDAKIGKLPINSMLTMVPVLWNGNQKQSLSPIVVMGRNKRITMARKGEKVNRGWGVIGWCSTARLPYKATIPFETWMDEVSLSIDKVLECCGDKETLPSLIVVSNRLQLSIANVHFGSAVKTAYLNEFQQTVKDSPILLFSESEKHLEKGSNQGLTIYFSEGDSTINESYMDNYNSIRQMRESIALVESDSNIYISKVNIVGRSSPKGGFIHNKKISQNRIESLIAYFSQDIDSNVFESDNIGENWDDLYRMVEKSDMSYRDEVLEIINNYPIYKKRKEKITALDGGKTYGYMIKEFFPELRTASYVHLFYDINPNDEFVNIDEASALIEANDYVKALEMLQEVAPTPYTDNLTGVCYMMTGDVANARTHLQKAADKGNDDAQKNLERLNYQRDNIQYK